MKVNQHQIVEGALTLMDMEGLDRLSMRALGTYLGVQASAMYWHVGSKDQLLSHMATNFYARALASAPSHGDWREWLTAFGDAFFTEILSHRDAARLCSIAPPQGEGNGRNLQVARLDGGPRDGAFLRG